MSGNNDKAFKVVEVCFILTILVGNPGLLSQHSAHDQHTPTSNGSSIGQQLLLANQTTTIFGGNQLQ